MSIHFVSQMKECDNTDQFVKNLLIPTLQKGKLTVKRDLNPNEKKKLQQPQNYVTQIILYKKEEENKPFEEKHKITLQFQRIYRENNYKYEITLGKYISALENQDMKDTERADFIATRKPFSGTPVESLKIPVEAIEKLKPEIIEKNGKKIALIKINEEHIQQILPYSKAGTFLWRLSGYVRFHSSEKTEGDWKILKSFFKGRDNGKKIYIPRVFEKFIEDNAEQLIEIINAREKTKEKIADSVSKKYGIQIGGYKTTSFEKLERAIKNIPDSEKKSMTEEIKSIANKP